MLRQAEATRIAALIGDHESSGITVLFNNHAGVLKGTFVRPSCFTPEQPATAETFVKALFDPVSGEMFANSFHMNAVGPYWLSLTFLPLLERWKLSPGRKRFVPQVITRGYCVMLIMAVFDGRMQQRVASPICTCYTKAPLGMRRPLWPVSCSHSESE